MKRFFESRYVDEYGLYKMLVVDGGDIVPFYDISGYYIENPDYDFRYDNEVDRYIRLSNDEGILYESLPHYILYEDNEGTVADIDARGYALRYYDGGNICYIHLIDYVGDTGYEEVIDLEGKDEWVELDHQPYRVLYQAKRGEKEVYIFYYKKYYMRDVPYYYVVDKDKIDIIEGEEGKEYYFRDIRLF